MAEIWPVYEGKEPTRGWPWAQLPLPEAVDLFDLQPDYFVSDLKSTPRFGKIDRDLGFAGFKHILVKVEPKEGRQANWRPGFYKSPIKPKEAYCKLIWQALAAKLGNENVVRVDYKPTTDSQGQEALKITIVIPPGATQRLPDRAVLDSMVNLRERLREMREERTPIVEFATDAELQRNDGP